MESKQFCAGIVYTLFSGEVMFRLSRQADGHFAIPKAQKRQDETERETALRAIRMDEQRRQMKEMRVRLDKVFGDDAYGVSRSGIARTTLYYAAYVDPQEAGRTLHEGEWNAFEKLVYRLQDKREREVLTHAMFFLHWKHGLRTDAQWISEMETYPGGCQGLWYREHAVDIHSHIIYGVDDGAQSLEEAVELIRLDHEEGADFIFATPHYGIENGYAPDAWEVREKFERLKTMAEKEVPGVTLFLGTEWYCAEDIMFRMQRMEAWPMNERRLYLVEFMEYGVYSESAQVITERLSELKRFRFPAILAHPERYKAVQQDWSLVRRLRDDYDVLMQVNAYDLYLNQDSRIRDVAQWMAEEELITFIGSDMHGLPPKRVPRMREGIEWLYAHTDSEYANDVVRRNAEQYLGVPPLLETWQPFGYYGSGKWEK